MKTSQLATAATYSPRRPDWACPASAFARAAANSCGLRSDLGSAIPLLASDYRPSRCNGHTHTCSGGLSLAGHSVVRPRFAHPNDPAHTLRLQTTPRLMLTTSEREPRRLKGRDRGAASAVAALWGSPLAGPAGGTGGLPAAAARFHPAAVTIRQRNCAKMTPSQEAGTRSLRVPTAQVTIVRSAISGMLGGLACSTFV